MFIGTALKRTALTTILLSLAMANALAQDMRSLGAYGDDVRSEMASAQTADTQSQPLSFTLTEPVREGFGTAHQVLGWATVAIGAATGILQPSLVGYETHEAFGWTAAGLSLTCMGTGIVAYGDEVLNVDMGWSVHHTHALLGSLGGALMLIAPFTSSSRAHQFVGEAGLACMAGALVLDLIWKITQRRANYSAPRSP
jgi:hypothetical protein